MRIYAFLVAFMCVAKDLDLSVPKHAALKKGMNSGIVLDVPMGDRLVEFNGVEQWWCRTIIFVIMPSTGYPRERFWNLPDE